MRDLRFIGNHLYAAGMGRQVYRREKPGKWVHRDAGPLQVPSTGEVAGFNSIDGPDKDDIYAVGVYGEIWHYHKKKWRQVSSPTNVILNRVRALRSDLAFAAGQNGVLLRGHGLDWNIVDHGSTEDQIWDMEWFNGRLYLATEDQIYWLKQDNTFESVDMKLGHTTTCGKLHANDGLLLSVGRKHVCWTEDGENWHENG